MSNSTQGKNTLENKKNNSEAFHFSKTNIIRDEMNLAEFPLSVLSTRVDPNKKTLEFQDTIYDKNRQPTVRKWIITGADKFGLPTASDEEVLMGLLKLSADQNFKSQKVEFTRYELLKILKWTTEGRSYTRLQKSLDRLSGVRIKATNAFYDIKSKQNCTKNFGIIDAYEINGGRGDQSSQSYFIWAETMFDSFQNGNIKKLDFDFYLSLKSAVSKRLYRYLDKHFWKTARIEDSLFKIAHEKLGISRNYKYASSLLQQLEPAVEELKEKNYISKFECSGKGVNTRVAFYKADSYVVPSVSVFDSKNSFNSQNAFDIQNNKEENSKEKESIFSKKLFKEKVTREETKKENTIEINTSQNKTSEDEILQTNIFDFKESQEEYQKAGGDILSVIKDKLLKRGIQEKQFTKLLDNKSNESLEKINNIILYFDYLIQKSSPLVCKSPVGWLYRAVQIEDKFNIPERFIQEYVKKENSQENKNKKEQSDVNLKEKKKEEEEKLHKLFDEERLSQIEEVKKEIGDEEILKIKNEVEESLKNIKGMISKERYEETITHAVNTRIAQSFALPSYDEWLKERKAV